MLAGASLMIVKDLDPCVSGDRFEKAGRAAEEQMAFYLRRALKDDPKIRIFNGFRFVRDGEVAQIDHLVLHNYGGIIVESKSVATEVRVGQDGAWTRVYNGVEQGMKSPVIQARMQGDLLRKLLEDHAAELLNKLLGIQTHFKAMPIDVLVAISDRGVLKRREGAAPEAMKADQIPDRILDIIANYRKGASMFSLSFKVSYSLNDSEVERISAFVVAHHTPWQRESQDGPAQDGSQARAVGITASATRLLEPESAASTETHGELQTAPSNLAEVPKSVSDRQEATGPRCAKCHSSNLKLEYRYNFFLRCGDCQAATPLVLLCGRCGTDRRDIQKPDTFKEHGVWSITCTNCGNAIPVDVTKPPTAASTAKQSLP
jgi:hypothetical protein